jgi:protein-L-isoaspartate(D-aspartate) O-methyltransferase
MLLVTRKDSGNYEARFLMQVVFVPCMGARDDATAKKLTQAFRNRNWTKIRTLHRNGEPDRSCWLAGNGWWLSTR